MKNPKFRQFDVQHITQHNLSLDNHSKFLKNIYHLKIM